MSRGHGRGRQGRAARAAAAPRPGTMAAPQLVPFTLVTPGSQVYIARSWRTVRAVKACQRDSLHGPMCQRFYLDDDDEGTHADLNTDVWIRHPVAGAS